MELAGIGNRLEIAMEIVLLSDFEHGFGVHQSGLRYPHQKHQLRWISRFTTISTN